MARIDMDKLLTFILSNNDTDNPDDKLGYYGIYDGSRGVFIGVSPKYKDQHPILLSNMGRIRSDMQPNKLGDMSPDLFTKLFDVYEKIVMSQETINDLKNEIEVITDLTDNKNKNIIKEKLEALSKIPKESEILNSTLISKDVILKNIKFDKLYADYFKSLFSFPIVITEGYEEFEIDSEIIIKKETLIEIKDDLLIYTSLNKNFNYSIKYVNGLLSLRLSFIFKYFSEDLIKHKDFLTKIVSINERGKSC